MQHTYNYRDVNSTFNLNYKCEYNQVTNEFLAEHRLCKGLCVYVHMHMCIL